ncbi:MAG TPA: glycerate kinase [Mycobacteriales bacterium]|nr:glycerate kinase [Mycobacteriales bacterium]
MRILVAPDSFGGTLSAVQAAEAIAEGWIRSAPADQILTRPLSDGGPGFVHVLDSVLDGRLLPVQVPDPLGRMVPATVLRVGATAYVESAQAAGLHLLGPADRDPLRTTSYGVGVMLAAAVETGARRAVVGLGGSGTNDAGAGMLAALGVLPLDAAGAALPYGGAALLGLDRMEGAPRLRGIDLIAASDVDNPLVGEQGASAVFGPQKGASPDDVALLDTALARWARVAERDLPGAPVGLAGLPGGGAAGGMGAALLALGGGRRSGIDLVREAVGLDAAVDGADLVLTGEGSFDSQSLRGKVAAGVARVAADRGRDCLVLAGQVTLGEPELAGLPAVGVRAAYSVAEHAGSVRAAMSDPAERLAALAADVAAEWSHRR